MLLVLQSNKVDVPHFPTCSFDAVTLKVPPFKYDLNHYFSPSLHC